MEIKKILNPKIWPWVIFIIMLVTAIVFRLTSYGRWGDSVTTNDISGYLETARIQTFSYDFLTAIRSPTYPLLFKVLAPIDEYQVTLISQPFFQAEGELKDQPGFDRVANVQMWTSILCWSIFALVIFVRFNNNWVRILAAGCVLVFAFSPQMADWDSIIMTESLSFSLFALLLALLIELAFFAFGLTQSNPLLVWSQVVVTVITALLFIFLRDTNTYFAPITFAFLCLLLAWGFRQNKKAVLPIGTVIVLLSGVFILQQVTFRASTRWLVPFYNNVTRLVFPYPDRVAYFQKFGMPVSEKLLKMGGSQPLESPDAPADFVNWARQNGLSTYSRFLIEHPVSAIKMTVDGLDDFFAINVQPYFFEGKFERPNWLIPYADYLHPLSPLPLLLDGILTLIVLGSALQRRRKDMLVWAWFASWLFCVSVALLTLGFLGEMRSTIRHVLGGVVPLRLALWIFLAIVADFMLSPNENKKAHWELP